MCVAFPKTELKVRSKCHSQVVMARGLVHSFDSQFPDSLRPSASCCESNFHCQFLIVQNLRSKLLLCLNSSVSLMWILKYLLIPPNGGQFWRSGLGLSWYCHLILYAMLSDNYPVFADGMLGRLALGGCQFSLVRHAFHACTQVLLALLIMFCSCLSSYSWVVTAMFHGLVNAKFAIATQPRIYLNPALAHNTTFFIHRWAVHRPSRPALSPHDSPQRRYEPDN